MKLWRLSTITSIGGPPVEEQLNYTNGEWLPANWILVSFLLITQDLQIEDMPHFILLTFCNG